VGKTGLVVVAVQGASSHYVSYIAVFLDENNSVKLGDFSLSKVLMQASLANTYVGVCGSSISFIHFV
jgi:hypothetical protein